MNSTIFRAHPKLFVATALMLAVVVAAVSVVLLRRPGPGSPGAPGPSAATSSCKPTSVGDAAPADIHDLGSPDGVAVVVSNTANNPLPSLGAKAQTVLRDFIVRTGNEPHLFSASVGAPQIKYAWTPLSSSGTQAGNAARAKDNLRALGKALTTPATTDGLDMFEALTVAADQLASSGARHPLVVMLGSGLDDKGSMTTTKGALNDDPATVADRVAKANPGVNLSKVTVLAQSLGYTSSPQQSPTATQRAVISDLWKNVLSKLGAAVVTDPAPGPGCSVATGKTVEPTALPSARVTSCGQGTINYELPASLLFGGDSSQLRSGDADLLAEPVRILRQNPGTVVELTGHTASSNTYTPDTSMRLSTDRAEAVGGILREAGIDASRITARGVGDTEPKHEDLNPDGTQNQYAAAERRVDLLIKGITSCPAA